MGADIPAGSGSGGPVGNGPDSDYESKAVDILNEDTSSESEPSEESDEETPSEEGESELPEETEDIPSEESESEPEEEPEPDPGQLTISGKEAYDKLRKEFPDALKNNPGLRQVFFREKAFSDIYTSVEEAKQAASNSEFLNGLSNALNGGNVKAVIESLSDKAKENLAENFIADLRADNHDLFVRATAPFVSNILNDAFDSANQRGDKNLANAVLHISRFLTGKFELPKRFVPKQVDNKLLEERQAFENEKRSFYSAQHQSFINSADIAVQNGLTKMLATGLDPDNQMSQFMRNAIIRETIQDVKDYVNKDAQFLGTLREMVNRSARAGYDGGSKSRLISAYLGRVKDIALKIRASKISEARKTSRATPEMKAPEYKRSSSERREQSKPQQQDKRMSELDVIRAR